MYSEVVMKPLQEAILKAVRSSGAAWLSRQEIAKRINRPTRLNPYDVEMLEGLVRDGYIEASTRIRGTVMKQRLYRATQKE
jgi:hypothetical protein